MVTLINNGLTRRDRAETITEAVLSQFPQLNYPYGTQAKEKMIKIIEEVLAEIEKPKNA